MSATWVWIVRINSKGQKESSGFPASELDRLRKYFNIVATYEGTLDEVNHLAVIRDCDMPPEWKTRERAKVLAGMRPLTAERAE